MSALPMFSLRADGNSVRWMIAAFCTFAVFDLLGPISSQSPFASTAWSLSKLGYQLTWEIFAIGLLAYAIARWSNGTVVWEIVAGGVLYYLFSLFVLHSWHGIRMASLRGTIFYSYMQCLWWMLASAFGTVAAKIRLRSKNLLSATASEAR